MCKLPAKSQRGAYVPREDTLNRAVIGGVSDTATYSVADLDLTNFMTVFLTVFKNLKDYSYLKSIL
jgi:hypothetical protein